MPRRRPGQAWLRRQQVRLSLDIGGPAREAMWLVDGASKKNRALVRADLNRRLRRAEPKPLPVLQMPLELR